MGNFSYSPTTVQSSGQKSTVFSTVFVLQNCTYVLYFRTLSPVTPYLATAKQKDSEHYRKEQSIKAQPLI